MGAGAAGLTLGIQYGAGQQGVALRVVHFWLLQCSECARSTVTDDHMAIKQLINKIGPPVSIEYRERGWGEVCLQFIQALLYTVSVNFMSMAENWK